MCVEAPGAPFLDPCKWSASPTATVPAGGTTNLTIALESGRFLNVRVNDPLQLLPVAQGSLLDFPHVIVGVVFGTGAFLPADTVSIDAAGRDLSMPVRIGVPLEFWVFSRHVTLQDAGGAAVDNRGTAIPFQAVTSSDVAFTIRVSGPAAAE